MRDRERRSRCHAAKTNGTVVDPNGIAIADDILPEDLAGVSGSGGRALILFSRLYGLNGVPEVQRLGYRVLMAAK